MPLKLNFSSTVHTPLEITDCFKSVFPCRVGTNIGIHTLLPLTAFKFGYYTEMIDWRAEMWRTASPIDWMVMKIRMRTSTKMIRTMTFCGSPSVITYLCQTRATAMFSARTRRLYLPRLTYKMCFGSIRWSISR